MFEMYKRFTERRKAATAAIEVAPKIYAIGRVNDQLRTRFGISGNTLDAIDLLLPSLSPIRNLKFQGCRYQYVGPYSISCDHRCGHQPYTGQGTNPDSDTRGTGSHGAAVNGCTQSISNWSMQDVYRRSLDGIGLADYVFVWLEDQEAYGSLVEIGYAHALGKPILMTHAPHINPKGELWFAFESATAVKCFESAPEAYGWFLQLVGQPAKD